VLRCNFFLYVQVLLRYPESVHRIPLLFDLAVLGLLVSARRYSLFKSKQFVGLLGFQLVYGSLNFIGASAQPVVILLLVHCVYLRLHLVRLHVVLLLGHVLLHLLQIEQL